MGFGFVGVYGSGLGRFRVLGVVRLMLFGFLSKESTPKLCFTGVSGLGLLHAVMLGLVFGCLRF